jgi:hypothetical protein
VFSKSFMIVPILAIGLALGCRRNSDKELRLGAKFLEPLLHGVTIGMSSADLDRLRPNLLKDDYSTRETLSADESISYWFNDGREARISSSGTRLAAVRNEMSGSVDLSSARDSILLHWQRMEGVPDDTIVGCVPLIDGNSHLVQVFVWHVNGLTLGMEELHRAPSNGPLQSLRVSVQRSTVPLEATLPGLRAVRQSRKPNVDCQEAGVPGG